MRNKLHLTINPYRDTSVSSSSWTIGTEEPERVAVRFKGKEYMIVLDEQPYFEIWSVDKDEELNELEEILKPEILNLQ